MEISRCLFFYAKTYVYFLSRLNFSTAFSSNAVSICKSVQLDNVTRVEVSTRYLIHSIKPLDKKTENEVNSYLCRTKF